MKSSWSSYKVYLLIGVCLMGVFFACKKNNATVNLHHGYFGLTDGRYVIYDVIEINHDVDASVKHDTDFYQLKTWIGQEYIDNQGRSAREFLRFKREDINSNWQQSDLWTAIIESNKAELVEENQRIVKLVFPPTLTKVWNMNAFNNDEEIECSYARVHDAYSVGTLTFDSTLTVDQQSFYSLVDCKRKFEVYANHIGLVYKYYKDLRINNFDTLDVEKGKELYYRCIGYGFE